MKILEAVKNLMENEGLSEHGACALFNIHASAVTYWTKKKDDLQYLQHSEKLNFQSGPYSILHNIIQGLVDFVEEWHVKGLLVNLFILIKKACQLKPILDKIRTSAENICFSLHGQERSHPLHGNAHCTMPFC